MVIIPVFGALIVLSGRASSDPALTSGSDDQETESGRASTPVLSREERLREFLAQHEDKAPLDISQIRRGKKYGKITSKDLCSLEQSILPASVERGKYLSHSFQYETYSALIHDFSLFIEENMVSLVTAHNDPHNAAYYTNAPHACALGLLGLQSYKPKELKPGEATLMSCSVVNLHKSGGNETHCVCRSPNFGLDSGTCISMLNSIAESYGIRQSIESVASLTTYPSYITMTSEQIELSDGEQVLTCLDSSLKVTYLELFMSYQRLTNQIERISQMFELEFPILNCEHDLANLNWEQLLMFLKCVKSHAPGTRSKRDLLSALGLRDDLSGFVNAANAAIKTNFEIVQENEQQIINQLKQEQEAVQKFMLAEGKNVETLSLHVAYIQSIFSSAERLSHHRQMLLSAVRSLTFSFDQLSQELDQLLQLSLSTMRQDPVVCLTGECIETKSLILAKDAKGVRITAREANIESETVFRMSCRLFPIGDDLYVHSLNDAALLRFNKRFVDRATKHQIVDECISDHQNCPSSPLPVDVSHLIQGNLYLSIHSGVLEAQCVTNTTLYTLEGNVSCSATDPKQVRLPLVHHGHLLENLHAHYYYSGVRQQESFTPEELIELEHYPIAPIITLSNYIDSLVQAPFNPYHAPNILAIIAAISVVIVTVLCICGCCCPDWAANVIRGIGKVLVVFGDGVKWIFTTCYDRAIKRHLNPVVEASAPTVSPGTRSSTLNLNNPQAKYHDNAEEIARLRGETSNLVQAAREMAGGSTASVAQAPPPYKRQDAFSSKVYNDTVYTTGNPGVFSNVMYNPSTSTPIKVTGNFPKFDAPSGTLGNQTTPSPNSNQAGSWSQPY